MVQKTPNKFGNRKGHEFPFFAAIVESYLIVFDIDYPAVCNRPTTKNSDCVLDLGPGAGEQGGQVMYFGPTTGLKDSLTGRYITGKRRISVPGKRRRPNRTHWITIDGAAENNLKGIRVRIPLGVFVCVTGVSGSGKSTLADDILFAEGQRRYLESLTPYVRQYMKILERPEVDIVTGLLSVVAIEQRISHASRRSTVATFTEIYHFLRLLYSKLGQPHCPGCGRKMTAQTRKEVIARVRSLYRKKSATILVPKVTGRKGFHKDLFAKALRKGYDRARVDGTFETIVPEMALSRYQESTPLSLWSGGYLAVT